jgi:hypothetical protein
MPRCVPSESSSLDVLRTVACWLWCFGIAETDTGMGGSSPLAVTEEACDMLDDDEPEPLRAEEDECPEPSEPVRAVPLFSQVKGGPDTCMWFV